MLSRLFSGRLNRRNFLIGNIVALLLIIVPALIASSIIYIFTPAGDNSSSNSSSANIFGGILYIFIGIPALVMAIVLSFAIVFRRLHDLGRSGLWVLLSVIPVLNVLIGLYLQFFPGESNNNSYGTTPDQKIRFPQDLLNN